MLQRVRHSVPIQRGAAALVVVVALLAAPATVHAHGQTSPIAANHIRIETDAPPSGVAFEFTSTDGARFLPQHNPATEGAAVLVRGVGANAGRTPLISFDPTKWTPIAGGYSYSDPIGERGGITSAVVGSGVLSISASEGGWEWSPAGPQDQTWVHFQIEDEWYCAEFSAANATLQTNQAGHFEATIASAPGGCPTQVCGNGVQELGEACDDGNLLEGDGCDNDCTIGSCNGTSFETTFEASRR